MRKLKKGQYQILVKIQSYKNSHLLLVEMQNRTATLKKNSLQVFYKSKQTYHMTQQPHY